MFDNFTARVKIETSHKLLTYTYIAKAREKNIPWHLNKHVNVTMRIFLERKRFSVCGNILVIPCRTISKLKNISGPVDIHDPPENTTVIQI